MSKAIAGKRYIFQVGDTLESIAAQAYGDNALWPRISKANQSRFKTSGPVPGDILNIPVLSEKQVFKTDLSALTLVNKDKNDLTILLAGHEVPIESASILKGVDIGTDGWNAVVKWEPGEDNVLDNLLKPYAYTPAAVYIGNELVINGILYTVSNQLFVNRSIKTLEGFSFTADVVDSNLKSPYEAFDISLKDRANQLIKPFGINVEYSVEEDEFFDRITASPSTKIFQHLAGLASQRGILVTSTEKGDMLFTRAVSTGKSVGTLEEGAPLVRSWNFTFDGRKRFNAYKAIGQSPYGAKDAISIDSKVPRPRFLTFTANDTTVGNIQQAADWRRNKQLAEAMANVIPVSSWYAPDGSLWRKNTLVTVVSKSMEVPDGFTFLIRRVTFNYSTTGQDAVLDIVPPEVYTGDAINEPW